MRAERKLSAGVGATAQLNSLKKALSAAAPSKTELLGAQLRPLSDLTELEAQWENLWQKTNRRFFLSWDWTRTAIEAADPAQLYVLRIYNPHYDLVGLGLFCAVTEIRHKFIRVRQMRLHETGKTAAATVDIEYNTLLTLPGLEDAAWEACVTALIDKSHPFDEVYIANATASARNAAHKVASKEGFFFHHQAEHTSAFTDLTPLQNGQNSTLELYLQTLGKNTRSQIRRSIRLYEEQGPLTLTRAQNVDEALTFFEEMASAHEAKWSQRGAGGIISNKHLYEFHQELITRCLDKGSVELVRISVGEAPFAWLYNFIDGEQVLYYMGGFIPGADNRFKPGLVAHALTIADHARKGKKAYDFMAGADRYKYNLGDYGPDLTSFSIQRPTFAFRVENAARRLKHTILKHTK